MQRFASLILGSATLLMACASSPVSASPTTDGTAKSHAPPPGSLVVDDFEDGDGTSLLGGKWFAYDDKHSGGESGVHVERSGDGFKMVGEGHESKHSLVAEFTFGRGSRPFEPFVGLGVKLLPRDADLRAYSALEFVYKGASHEVRIETANVKKWDFYVVQLPESPVWKAVQLPFPLFRQSGWGPKAPFALESTDQITWHIRGKHGQSGKLQVDGVRLVPASALKKRGPNLTIQDPTPPPAQTMEAVAISHPLQKVALEKLDRGYNLASFLEAKRFQDFGDYDEAFIKKLAAAGYKGLRLPIDLDQYVESKAMKGDAMEISLHDDLFKVLDAYDKWTADAGLSLTIDYHQYDESYEVGNAESEAEMVALWGKLAEHFAKSERTDLFYELLNEPELAAGPRGPTQDEWTKLATRMIAAIRQHDRTRPILFGDVKSYDIDELVKRTPFKDPNVIYVFHYYEPLIFTHQGAHWAKMESVHGVPYPYKKARWSNRMEDLGFSDLSPAGQLYQLRNYHKTGNRTQMQADLVKVKHWAVKHGVPIICNEFGVYMASARKEDIARYYTDLIGLFRELEIPWQSWFQLMNPKTGTVDPAYRKAMGLD